MNIAEEVIKNAPTEVIKNAPTDVLCEAARTLQKAHDYVETNEFNITNYLPTEEEGLICCFVGSVHHFSGDTEPTRTRSETARLALSALDAAAMNYGASWEDYYEAGSTAEAYGANLYGDNGHQGPCNDKKKGIALNVYRQALRIMHTELMSREDVPVPA